MQGTSSVIYFYLSELKELEQLRNIVLKTKEPLDMSKLQITDFNRFNI